MGQRRVASAILAIVAALACGERAVDPGTANRGDSSVVSTAGRYRLAIRPAHPPPRLGQLHEWIVRVERTDPRRPNPSQVFFDGGMPTHGHGFVTKPRVTRALGEGEFLVEGVKFHMAGPWEIRVAVVSAEGTDGASFRIEVSP